MHGIAIEITYYNQLYPRAMAISLHRFCDQHRPETPFHLRETTKIVCFERCTRRSRRSRGPVRSNQEKWHAVMAMAISYNW